MQCTSLDRQLQWSIITPLELDTQFLTAYGRKSGLAPFEFSPSVLTQQTLLQSLLVIRFSKDFAVEVDYLSLQPQVGIIKPIQSACKLELLPLGNAPWLKKAVTKTHRVNLRSLFFSAHRVQCAIPADQKF
jgi:hypothetical protein